MSDSNLKMQIAKWLREQGYPLEMRTARVFTQRGWFLHHSRRYKDPNLGKDREIDLLAFNDDPQKSAGIHGHFVIECKWTPAKPWVLFTATQQTLTKLGHFRSTPMTTQAEKAVKDIDSKHVSNLPLFAEIKEGYALVQAFSKDEAINAGYSAVQGAVAAADFFAKELHYHCTVYVPTVVLDGELFECSLAKNGDVDLRPLKTGVLLHNTATGHSKCVHIVRESALSEFIDRAEITFQRLRATLATRRRPAVATSDNGGKE